MYANVLREKCHHLSVFTVAHTHTIKVFFNVWIPVYYYYTYIKVDEFMCIIYGGWGEQYMRMYKHTTHKKTTPRRDGVRYVKLNVTGYVSCFVADNDDAARRRRCRHKRLWIWKCVSALHPSLVRLWHSKIYFLRYSHMQRKYEKRWAITRASLVVYAGQINIDLFIRLRTYTS